MKRIGGAGALPAEEAKPRIHFVVAMACEARPLVEHYTMRATRNEGPFRVFASSNCSLVVSGIGKIAAAAATSFLYAYTGCRRNQVWINVGVGGHTHRPLEELVLAHKITDVGSGSRYYPPLVLEPRCDTTEVLTVDAVEEEYGTEGVYEMEAAGFWATASRFSTGELVQVLKVISDNRSSSVRQLEADRIEAVVGARVGEVAALAAEVAELARELDAVESESPWLERLLGPWRFTVSQRRRLVRLLARLRALDGGDDLPWPELYRCSCSRDVLELLERRADELPLRLGGQHDKPQADSSVSTSS